MSLKRSARGGTALVLALILLVALLLLGLPFLFSQSASLAGTRAFSDSRMAQIGRDNAANVAAAIAAHAIGPAFTAAAPADPVPPAWSSLPDDLQQASTPQILKNGVLPVPATVPSTDDTDGSVAVDPAKLGVAPFPPSHATNQNHQSIYLGATISDESGKLDPNTMSPYLWGSLLAAAGILDWDDSLVYLPWQHPGDYVSDPDNYGQLAQALAHLRTKLPGRRITDLDQLLQADTSYQQWNLLRWPLTRAELEKIRPALSLHNPRLGRSGLIDLGSVVQLDAWHDTEWIDSNPEPHLPVNKNVINPNQAFSGPQNFRGVVPVELLVDGTTVMGENTVLPGGAHVTGMVDDPNGIGESNIWGSSNHIVLGEPFNLQGVSLSTQPGQALMIDAPAPLNGHQISYLVRVALGNNTYPTNNPPTVAFEPLPKPISEVVSTIGSTSGATSRATGQTGLSFVLTRPNPAGTLAPVDLLRYVSPVYTGFEFPPLGILSGGVFAIDATATVTDVAGHQVAQSSRRDLVQAVPQENLLERRWLTQGAFHALIAGRYGSHVQSWPVPFERLTTDASNDPIAPDDVDPSIAGLTPKIGGLRPRPLPGFASVSLATQQQIQGGSSSNATLLLHNEWLSLVHLAIDWRLSFGANTANPQQGPTTVFNAEQLQGSPPPVVSSLDLAAANGPSLANLHPDGFHHDATTRLSYALVNPAGNGGNANVPTLSSFVTVRPSSNTAAVSPALPLANTYEMDSRHLSLWIQPQANWTSGMYPLWEMRMPAASTGSQVVDATGTGPGSPFAAAVAAAVGGNGWAQATAPGSNGSQNYCGLFYDATQRLLVLVMAPPSIEHTADDAIHVPPNNPAAQLVDALSLGDNTTPSFLSLAPAQPVQGLQKFTQLFEPNRVLHCFYTPDDAAGNAYFRKDQWYHIQVAIADDRPDGIALLVDGIAGTDVMKANPSSPTLANLGDHCTLPTLALTQAIPYVQIQDGDPNDPVNSPVIGNLTVSGVTINSTPQVKLTASDLLPPRGVVRIDDEYFLYNSIAANGTQLQGVTRARRQDSWVAPHGTPPALTLPNTQAHSIGTLVTPGGYRIAHNLTQGQRLYRGGWTLTDPVYNGDSNAAAGPSGLHYGQVWGLVSPQGLPSWQPNTAFKAINIAPQPETPITIICPSPLGSEFPKRGWIQIAASNGLFQIFYSTCTSSPTGATFSGLSTTAFTPANTHGVPWNPPVVPPTGIQIDPNNPPALVLISIGVSGPVAPTLDGMYSWGFFDPVKPGKADSLIALQQIPDQTNTLQTGRVEWIHYNTIIDDIGPNPAQGGGFFIDTGGFAAGNRGQGRTAWAGNVSELTNPNVDFTTISFFSSGSAVLPVQTEASVSGHWLTTGDVVTLLPHAQNPLPVQGMQMTVRFGATDGLPPTVGASSGWTDVKNEYFSFTGPLPIPVTTPGISLNNIEALVGDCWSGNDLTTTGNGIPQPRGYLPRLDLFTDPGNSAGTPPVPAPGRVFFGSVDLDRAVGLSYNTSSDVVIDDLVAGQLCPDIGNPPPTLDDDDGGNVMVPLPTSIVALYQNGAPVAGIAPGVAGITGLLVEATSKIFPYSANGNMGLVAIDGEVFAYQTPSNADFATIAANQGLNAQQIQATLQQWARLVARGLLGSTFTGTHILNASNGMGRNALLSAVRLPIGPVLQLQSPIQPGANGATGWFALCDQASSNNPAATTLYAPQSMIVNPDGTAPEMLALIGPKIHHPEPSLPSNPPDPQIGQYCTASWIRGLYNSASGAPASWNGQASDAPQPIVIGWWPRYASALPAVGTTLTAQHLRSRTYSWVGLPFAVSGGYFDPLRVAGLQAPTGSLPLAQVDVEDAAGTFVVEARALSYKDTWTSSGGAPAMDWSLQDPVQLVSTGSAVFDASPAFAADHDHALCFSDGNSPPRYQAVDGAELRLSWRYAKPAAITTALDALAAIAQAGNRAPSILDARLRCLAPIRVIATERDR